ncbi:MAG: AmmeMemoRadiSam system radical SAM enzyme [Candidatus Nanoarchaeia archaeon]
MKECTLYKTEKDSVRCLACAHKCLIENNKTGICAVRRNFNGKLYSLVHGRIVSAAVDPIEKKPLYHFFPGTKAFSIGTVGCNFKCDFCQNFDISQISKTGVILGEEFSPEKVVEHAIVTNCKSIAYTYNEPAVFIEYVREIASLAKKKGLRNILVTNGYLSKEAFELIKYDIDAMNIDLKGDEKFYKKYCGAKLKPVKDTIKRAYDNGIHVEITTLLIPGENDSEKTLKEIAKFIASIDKNIVWHISRFFPKYKMLKHSITPISTLEKAYKIGKKYLNYVYVGNV